MPSVRLADYPELRDAIERHAARWLHGGAKAVLSHATWAAICRGEQPGDEDARKLMAVRFGDDRPDEAGDAGCGCDPPLD